MAHRLRPKSVILIGLGVLLAGAAIWSVLSNRQPRSLPAVTWPLEQRTLSDDERLSIAQRLGGKDAKYVIYLHQITTPELATLFPQAAFYCYSGNRNGCFRLAVILADHVYQMPWDFNRLLADANVQVTDDNSLIIARTFIGLAHRGLLDGTRLSFYLQLPIDEIDPQLPQYHYQWEIHVRAEALNTLTAWKVGFQEGRIHFVQRTLVGRNPEGGTFEDPDPDRFSSRRVLGAAIPRRDTEYYLCCTEQGQLLMTYSSSHPCCDQHGRLIEDPSWSWAPSPSGTLPVELTAEWQTAGGPERDVDTASLDKARQLYPDQVNETWAHPWSVDWISPELVSMTSGQKQRALFPGSSDQILYFVQASPFSWTAVPSASYVGIVANHGDKVYRLPEDFNLLLADVGPSLTTANQVGVAQAFIWATHRELVTTFGSIFLTEPKMIDETDTLHPTYHYQLEMDSWARERGVWAKWKFGFEDGRIAVVHYMVLGRFVGSWQSTLHPNVQDPFFTSNSKYYVCCDEKGALR